MPASCFTSFQKPTDAYPLPEKFTFPFYYDPHPLCILAAEQLQHHLETQTDWVHNFGINPNHKGLVIGKMFGVLVVQNEQGEIGYLSAFSGKLADENHHPGFVPPVFDMLTKDSFFQQGAKVLNELNAQIADLEKAQEFLTAKAFLEEETNLKIKELENQKQKIKAGKKARKLQRLEASEKLSPEDFKTLEESLALESQKTKLELKYLTLSWNERLKVAQKKLAVYQDEIIFLQKERKNKSNALQQKLFDHYQFLNQLGLRKNLNDIFQEVAPPAGSGECAAPKLLQYAFLNKMKPIAMAEFYWGQAPNTEIRKHGHYYPACNGKCKPILAHMLEGMEVDENPLLLNPAIGKQIEVIYEDDHLAVVNKPAEFLSVPGKTIQDSVAFRMKKKYPKATGPLIVHRLDMSTSGLMLIAKSMEVHKFLQHQFIKRTIKKRYIAVLNGNLSEQEGIIDLPLRVDLDDRPRQLVCYEHGKQAQTKWKVIKVSENKTRVHFFPITGRTHQLRVHASHSKGLNCPIIGDDLYGQKVDRLHLHAEFIEFLHPETRERMSIQVDPDF